MTLRRLQDSAVPVKVKVKFSGSWLSVYFLSIVDLKTINISQFFVSIAPGFVSA